MDTGHLPEIRPEVRRTFNPLTLSKDFLLLDTKGLDSPNGIIRKNKLTFLRPVILIVNGQAVMRKDWDTPLKAGDLAHFVELPGGGEWMQFAAILAVVALAAISGGAAAALFPAGIGYGATAGAIASAVVKTVVMVGGSMLVNQFFGGNSSVSDPGRAQTVYNFSGSSNSFALGSPFPEHFGRFVCYPDYVMTPYTEFIDNEQYLYILGIIGVGQYSIESVSIDKTRISSYPDSTYNILPPGSAPTLCPKIVYPCAGASGQELDIEENAFSVIVNPAGTSITRIGIDINFPAGLCEITKEGKFRSRTMEIHGKARKVNADGSSAGDWVSFPMWSFTASSKDPVRRTISVSVPSGAGRYEIMLWRTAKEAEHTRIMEKAVLAGVNGYGPTHPDYGDVTLIECRIKATDQINGSVADRLNVVATRKLYSVTSGGFGTTLTATRSIVDACAYIVTASNGANQPSSILDFESLAALRSTLETNQNYFDWRFTSRTSVMDACSKAARCGRAVPYMPGGLFSLVRDEPKTTPSQVYNEDDYTEGSLSVVHAIRTADSPTCVEVKYTNPDTWQSESVYCVELGGSYDNPTTLQLEGCTSRQKAWEEGIYSYRDDQLNRTTVSFTTGLKGHIPKLGDNIVVSASMTDWGQTGLVAAIDTGVIWLSEPVDFNGMAEGFLYVTSENGGVAGPYTVTPTDHSHCVGGVLPDTCKNVQEDGDKASKFVFAVAIADFFLVRVSKVVPVGINEVQITGSIVNNDVYGDAGTAPAVGTMGTVAALQAVEVTYQGVDEENNSFRATWSGSAIKFRVEVNRGSGYAVEADNLVAYAVDFVSAGLSVTVKVTPYTGDTLDTASAKTATITVPAAPANFRITSVATDGTMNLAWSAVTGAGFYDVGIIVDDEEVFWKSVTGTTTTFTLDEFVDAGGVWPAFTLAIYAVDSGAIKSAWATVDFTATAPAAPTGFVVVSRLEYGFVLSWNAVAGAVGYKVYSGSSASFVPATNGTSRYDGADTECAIIMGTIPDDYTYYFKVAGVNHYTTDISSLDFSDTLTVIPLEEDETTLLQTLTYIISGINAIFSWTGAAADFQVQTPDGTFTHYSGNQITIPGKVGDPLTARAVTVTVTPYNENGGYVSSEQMSNTVPASSF